MSAITETRKLYPPQPVSDAPLEVLNAEETTVDNLAQKALESENAHPQQVAAQVVAKEQKDSELAVVLLSPVKGPVQKCTDAVMAFFDRCRHHKKS